MNVGKVPGETDGSHKLFWNLKISFPVKGWSSRGTGNGEGGMAGSSWVAYNLLKYWHQSTWLGIANNQTKHPVSGLKRKPCPIIPWGVVSTYIHCDCFFYWQALEAELSGRFAHCETVIANGQSLIDRGHYASKEIRGKIKQLQHNWMKLKELLITRSDRLKDAAQSLQVNHTTASTYRAVISVLFSVQRESCPTARD